MLKQEPVGANKVDARQRAEQEAMRREQVKTWLKTLSGKRIIIRYVHSQPIYMLFNPWNDSQSITLTVL